MAKIASLKVRNSFFKSSQQPTECKSASEGLESKIEKLAYQYFVERGYEHGHDHEDWLRAEAAVLKSQGQKR